MGDAQGEEGNGVPAEFVFVVAVAVAADGVVVAAVARA